MQTERNFFNHKTNELEEKVKDVKMYFVRNGVKQPVLCEPHRIRIPTLNWVRLKEKGSDQSENTYPKKWFCFHEGWKVFLF